MAPPDSGGLGRGAGRGLTLAEAASHFVQGAEVLPVAEGGRVVGSLSRTAVLRHLLGA